MHLIKLHRTCPKFKTKLLKYYSQVAVNPIESSEYTETPQYPPIVDNSFQANRIRKRDAVHEKIRKINTVEEKQLALNMPKYYGWKCVRFHEDKVPFNAMPLVQFYTRTHFVPGNKLPDFYMETEPASALLVKEIKGLIEDAIALEFEGIKRNIKTTLDKPDEQQREDAMTKSVVEQLNRIIMNKLVDRVPHILTTQVDIGPRHEAFWFVGGVDPPKKVKTMRRKLIFLKDNENEPLDRPVQYTGTPILALRNNLPLRPILDYSEATNPVFSVPKYSYHPETTSYTTEYRHGTNIPGYWLGDQDEFGLLSIHGRGHLLSRKESFGPEDNLEALHCQAMKASFGWLLAQANYQGFTTFNDITYPLATQTLITNGQFWSLYAYQLNTIVMHNEYANVNPKHNVCFGTEPMKLFDKIENGKVLGLNEDVLKMIIQLYLNVPEERDYDLKPYLGDEEKYVADIEDDKKRNWLEKTYKHIVSNRPRHRLAPEYYHWEYIYKIWNKTRNQEAKRRPFDLDKNPWQRRLDDHQPAYIPKVLRAYPKSKKKWEQTYFPDV